MNRYQQREQAFYLIFEASFFNYDIEEVLSHADEFENEPICDFAKSMSRAVIENLKAVDDKIVLYAKGWKLNRISKVSLAILRLAVYEAFFSKTTPEGVAINEAIDLAKKFDTDDAPSFINGVLGSISREKKED
ncbi:MAG: transcription antitermination factor NusB [Clostridia bacterium]